MASISHLCALAGAALTVQQASAQPLSGADVALYNLPGNAQEIERQRHPTPLGAWDSLPSWVRNRFQGHDMQVSLEHLLSTCFSCRASKMFNLACKYTCGLDVVCVQR